MITVSSPGSFKRTSDFLSKMSKMDLNILLNKYGQVGVDALARATPVDSGLTANKWAYTIETTNRKPSIVWRNTNVNDGVPVAIILQYGHGTGTGGYVHGIDYINPAIRPIFDQIAAEVWKQVTNG